MTEARACHSHVVPRGSSIVSTAPETSRKASNALRPPFRLRSAQNDTLRLPLFVLFFLLLAVVARAGDFEMGNDLFDQGKFSEARQHYENLVEAGLGSANVYYNLGNTDFRLGSAGRAMLDYERALALNPRHPEARENLKFLREQSASRLPPEPWSAKIFATQPLNTWLLTATVAAWASRRVPPMLARCGSPRHRSEVASSCWTSVSRADAGGLRAT